MYLSAAKLFCLCERVNEMEFVLLLYMGRYLILVEEPKTKPLLIAIEPKIKINNNNKGKKTQLLALYVSDYDKISFLVLVTEK